MVRVEMDGYVLPIVNELTGVVGQDFFVPIGKEFKNDTNWSVVDDGSLDEIVLEIKSHGPSLSDIDNRRHEMQWEREFSGIYMKELAQAQSRYFVGASHLVDAAGASSLAAGTGALAVEYFPSFMGIGGGVVAFCLAGVVSLLSIQGVKSLVDARAKRHAGTIADHFSTNLYITQGDDELSSKVMELHAHFETLEGPSKQVNLGMAKKADELGLPAVKAFYEKRIDRRGADGMMYKLFAKGLLHSMAVDIAKWFKGDDTSTVEQIGKDLGGVAQQSKVNLNIPVTLLPSFNGYDIFVGHQGRDNLNDFATRAGDGLETNITFEIFTPDHISQEQKTYLEDHIADAIHDNVYRMARIFNVLPKKLVETGSKASKYISIGGGIATVVGGGLTLFLGSPIAAAAFGIGGVYLLVRPFFTKPLERADKLPYERLIRGYDVLQENLDKVESFTYIRDPALCIMDEIMREHDTPYLAYIACVNKAKQLNRPRIAGHYIHKALSVQPMDRELRPGIMELAGERE